MSAEAEAAREAAAAHKLTSGAEEHAGETSKTNHRR